MAVDYDGASLGGGGGGGRARLCRSAGAVRGGKTRAEATGFSAISQGFC